MWVWVCVHARVEWEKTLSIFNAGGKKPIETKRFQMKGDRHLLPCIIGRKEHT